MRELIANSTIYSFDTFADFVKAFQIGSSDLIITNEFILTDYDKKELFQAHIIYQERYGQGEPSDAMFEAMHADISALPSYNRIIGIGGGTVLDISKLFALKYNYPIDQLFDRKLPLVKDKELILVPTTCGTGSEVTNISVLLFSERNTKMGLAADALYADKAVLIPQFIERLPFRFFATSSIDALIHAIESSISPRATSFSKLYGYKAIEIILRGYQTIVREGEEARTAILKDFLLASNYAGLAFGTAGCGPVHALSYPLSGTFHVAHGEANYAIFSGVMNKYLEISANKNVNELKSYLASILECDEVCVFDEMEKLLSHIVKKNSLEQYGVKQEMLSEWALSVLSAQERLLKNSPIALSYEDIIQIYKNLY